MQTLFIPLLLGGCSLISRPESGCTKDTDCKQDRICEDRRCVSARELADEVPVSPDLSTAAPPSAPEKAVTARFFRGGPGLSAAASIEGPRTAPSLRWDLDLGAVIYASPRLGTDAEGRTVAYVGTHGGRLVGVVVDGAEAGTRVLDLDLGVACGRRRGLTALGGFYVGTDADELVAVDLATRSVAWRTRLGTCKQTTAPGPEGRGAMWTEGPPRVPGATSTSAPTGCIG